MYFSSDNAGMAHPAILQAILDANTGYAMPYGKDEIMEGVRESMRSLFEAPEAAVYLVATGTAANSLSLATLAEPWQTVYCSPVAHIQEDECNAPEFYMGAGKLTPIGQGDKITPDDLAAVLEGGPRRDVHAAQPGPLSITQATEKGRLYSVDEVTDLASMAHDCGLPVHMDGARFANAIAALNVSPADMTWRAGVDVLSFGGTKNGCVGVEAVVLFDPELAWEFELRRKRGAHLFSKHRYLSAQMQAYLADDLWLDMAGAANANLQMLADGMREIGVQFLEEPEANILFAYLPRAMHARLQAAGARYYVSSASSSDPAEPVLARFVCDWSLPTAEIDHFLNVAAG
ncbi:low specificity L-threonine aldolase [Pseudooceanicola sp. CBS1P-1]|uniref:Low specificity L-threonine aldolase n=1 Tax=Pseudooceanicola albus TaxID=2692189 RepID=A0A6L7G192_9RHOB|nr:MULTISPECIES: beta-eliminating lyase-related protein [Pseudooceanicola]MBT9382617.1 low specificity L-threonine aldolase [Pseudooceanicola endophyticus]MXN17157.1 low specificity L-threonine aldolase [Pseudooceanicola albus]